MEQTLIKYLTHEYWNTLFKNKGFTPYTGICVDWNFVDLRTELWWSWYIKNDFVVGYDVKDIRGGKAPSMIFCYKPKEENYTKVEYRLNLKKPQDTLQIIDSISNPSHMPLSINIGWATDLVYECLKDIA